MSEQAFVEHPLDTWLVVTLRLTAFLVPGPGIDKQTWWQDIIGEPSEKQTSQPKQGISDEQGPFNGGMLTLRTTPGRIDWIFSVGIDQIIEQSDEVSPFVFPTVLEKFVVPMTRWVALDTCPKLQRLAFGAVLLQPVDTPQDGYQRLDEYLHYVTLAPESSSDLLYQINRRRPSNASSEPLSVNRLSKWAVARIQGARFALRGPEAPPVHFVGSHSCFVRLELDISTSAEFPGELASLSNILNELVELGREIASQGDIP